jgi:DNA mismatch endonuclease, patch repair protein
MDRVSPEVRSRIMAAIRGKNTRPELAVRSALHRMGYRFRIHVRSLRGSPDIVLARHGAVIFVHGCFWHAHHCRAGRAAPRTNAAFWKAKREGNRHRDRLAVRALRREGWRVLVLWECQLRDAERLISALRQFLAPPGPRAVAHGSRTTHVTSKVQRPALRRLSRRTSRVGSTRSASR